MSADFDDAFTEEISEPCPEGSGVTIDDFVGYVPAHVYIFTPCREFWPSTSVNARLKRMPVPTKGGKPKLDGNGRPLTMLARTWLDQNRPVEQMTWAPGMPMLIPGHLVIDGGWTTTRPITGMGSGGGTSIESGFGHVAAYLCELDLTDFDPKAPPPKTAAFWDIVAANSSPEDAELADVLEALGNPDAVTLLQLIEKAQGGTTEWLMDRRNRRAIPHRQERCRCAPVRNPTATDGLWKLKGGRQVIYAKTTLSRNEQVRAARELLQRQ
jgi:hypothetical protein